MSQRHNFLTDTTIPFAGSTAKIFDLYFSTPDDIDERKFSEKYISMNPECPTDFKNINSINPKKGGANIGSNISVYDKKGKKITFTIKQGRNIGHTLADIFGFLVMNRLLQENKSDFKETKKTIIAPSYMVFKAEEKKPVLIEEETKKIWSASEWSEDQLSFAACQLFGLEKRTLMAGTFNKYLFVNLRALNEKCQLGLEFVVLAAIYTADFDLHLENILFKMNTTKVESTHKLQVDTLIEEFKNILKMRAKFTEIEYLNKLINLIQALQVLGVYCYFQKIDHDNAFRHFCNSHKKVLLKDDKTSPLYFSKHGIETQATLHIAELTGLDEKAIDQLLLSDSAIKFLKKNTLHKYIDIIKLSAEIQFQHIQNATSYMNISIEDKKIVEYQLLSQFYYFISELTFELNKDMQIDAQIQLLKHQILEKLIIGATYKMNDLYIQLYERLKKKKIGEFTINLTCFESFLLEQLKICHAEYIQRQWKNIKDQYMNGKKKMCGIFTSYSHDSQVLIYHLEAIFLVLNKKSEMYNAISYKNTLLIMIFDMTSTYLLNNSHRRLGKIMSQELNVLNFKKLSKIIQDERAQMTRLTEKAEKFRLKRDKLRKEFRQHLLQREDSSIKFYSPGM